MQRAPKSCPLSGFSGLFFSLSSNFLGTYTDYFPFEAEHSRTFSCVCFAHVNTCMSGARSLGPALPASPPMSVTAPQVTPLHKHSHLQRTSL